MNKSKCKEEILKRKLSKYYRNLNVNIFKSRLHKMYEKYNNFANLIYKHLKSKEFVHPDSNQWRTEEGGYGAKAPKKNHTF